RRLPRPPRPTLFPYTTLFRSKRGEGSFRSRYQELVEDERIGRRTVKAIDLFKRIMVSQLETGNPFMFYRDEVNRKNPNKHCGTRSEEHTSELQSRENLVCRLL